MVKTPDAPDGAGSVVVVVVAAVRMRAGSQGVQRASGGLRTATREDAMTASLQKIA